MPDHSEAAGLLRYRQIEYYRMPLMAYLALDDPRTLFERTIHRFLGRTQQRKENPLVRTIQRAGPVLARACSSE